MTTAPVEAFRADGPLPSGVTLLEASAGTGKTHTIAGLVARHVAEGTALDRLLVVTFTRMATGELRERVRSRLREADGVLNGLRTADGDLGLEAIAGPATERVARRERIHAALCDFDSATITTIHGFCRQMLITLGIAADGVERSEPLEDTAELQLQVVDDLFLREFRGIATPPFTRDAALAATRLAVANPLAPAVPQDLALARFAEAARAELALRLRRLGLVTHDDLLLRLHAALHHPRRGGTARARLRARFDVILIDEFQDTDPVQWDIVRAAFGESRLVLIGDPKQAIYGFRGADVHAYLQAGARADRCATLATNWRTDQPLLDALDAVFAGRDLGHEDIPFRTVHSARPELGAGLAQTPPRAPLRVRIARRDTEHIGRLTAKGYATVEPARAHIAADVAGEAARMLASGARVRTGDTDAPVSPGDIAVLVRTNAQASRVRDALEAAGVPAVIAGAGSVFETAAATDWLALLRAVERPSAPAPVAAAALTDLIGWDAATLADAGDAELEDLHRRLHEMGDTLRHAGVAGLLERIAAEDDLAGRVLARTDGERTLTDLRHVAQLLHAAGHRDRLGTPALVAWLAERVARVRNEGGDERSRRLESDAAAVQVLTVHRAKGLEFPIVFCPYLWDAGEARTKEPRVLHDAAHGGRRVVDVGGTDAEGAGERIAQYLAEERGEDLRLAYVALTRARHAAVVWWAASWGSRLSPLHALLFPDHRNRVPDDDEAASAIAALGPEHLIAVETTAGGDASWTPAPDAPAHLDVAPWDRTLDRAWRRTSYSAIVAGAYEPMVASEPEEEGRTDEPAATAGDGDAPAGGGALPLADAPAGVGFGSLVHEVLETVDFVDPDLGDDLARRLAERAPAWDVSLADPAAVARGLVSALQTPLPMGLRLSQLTRADRLDELAFELPLAGGDRPSGHLRTDAVAALLERRLAPDDPFAAYAARLREPGIAPVLRGHLTGSLDLVARLPDDRFAVFDYKTNHLGRAPSHYAPAALADAMRQAHYPLQALLYLVCLHRFLRWRVRDYAPERHLAGAGYLFLRGMAPATGTGAGDHPGVFWWVPPDGLVGELSDLLDEGAP